MIIFDTNCIYLLFLLYYFDYFVFVCLNECILIINFHLINPLNFALLLYYYTDT